ncbi:unnamed protein product [Penicillium bialowiezense]
MQDSADQPQDVFSGARARLSTSRDRTKPGWSPYPNSDTSTRLVRLRLSRDHDALVVIKSPCERGIVLLPQEALAWPTDGETHIVETWNGDCENPS